MAKTGSFVFLLTSFFLGRSFKYVQRSPTTAKRVNIEHDTRLWRLVTDHPNIFDTHIVTKLNGNDVKCFYDVNTESRAETKS